ncbi:MAG TPA: 16S rRNA (cytidine(1402)-2'-O)-methyltransferase [Firmicutes bacterium]|nr:16S rRNA (cytidine(1402)-2'-O)-methyltransferase [Bacillota bacterium]
MAGRLYVVGTPIGNLGDLSPRAAQTLAAVDFIAAEDTRVTRGLLNHLDIHKPLVSYYEHNARQKGPQIVERLLAGESAAIVTDAGMPCISDPGEQLVALCAQAGVETVVIPGPSAVVAALALSGLPTGRFAFEGFLSANKGERRRHLEAVAADDRTLIFYEAPHKAAATLADMAQILGDRPLAVARELTKLHEEIWRTTLGEAAARYAQEPPRGELVLVVGGAEKPAQEEVPLEEALAQVASLQAQGVPLKEAARQVAAATGLRKNQLYQLAAQQGNSNLE